MTCDGSGKVPCGACDGTGRKYHGEWPNGVAWTCTTCKGSGVDRRCPGCEECKAAKAARAKGDGQGKLF